MTDEATRGAPTDDWKGPVDPESRPLTLRQRLGAWWKRAMPLVAVAALLFVMTLLFFYGRIVITINEGQQGVLWRRFGGGTDLDMLYLEGTHFIVPWNRMTIYDVRLQREDNIVTVLSTDGLEIKVYVSIRYRPAAKTTPQLHQAVGPDYLNRVIIPEVLTAVRQIMGQYRPEQLYTLRTDQMQRQIVARAAYQVRDRFLIIDDVLIRAIELPEPIQQAIQRKLVQEQEALEYAFRIEKERQERTRKEIEAQGIQQFQRIVSASISAPLLRWKGIEATLELAKSTNAKVVVIGNGGDGLPLILNMPGMPATLSAPDAPAAGSLTIPSPAPSPPPGAAPSPGSPGPGAAPGARTPPPASPNGRGTPQKPKPEGAAR